MKTKSVPVQGPSIVVGLDYGTTYSSAAFSIGGMIEDIEVLDKWPGGGNRTSAKVPSVISYEGQKTEWGYHVTAFAEACRGVKLLLDQDREVEYVPSLVSRIILQGYGKDPVQATGDYLRYLIQQVHQVLERRLGIDAAHADLQFVLTVPAVWSDKAKDATLRAAISAGANPREISLISEPEAAAIYTLRAIQPNSIATNDVFVVCDAGGGTVDLIPYRILNLEPMLLEEVTEGTGEICGSLLLDGRFEDLLRRRMGGMKYRRLSEKTREAAITYWQERVKPNFTGKYDDDYADVDYFVLVAGAADDPDVPIEDGFFQLSSQDVEAIFEPIVAQIERLVARQVSAVADKNDCVKAILLVGGFGASEYLYHRLQEANPTTTILQPADAWSAVVSGAVHRGLEGNKVESRIARRNYGVKHSTAFQKWLHHDDDPHRYWCPLEESWKMSGRMKWYIEKSSKISENTPIKMDFYCTIRVDDDEGLLIHEKLQFYNEDSAPAVFNDRGRDEALRAGGRPPQGSTGQEYFKIPFVLTMTPTSASLLFELEFNGVSYGSVRSKY
ncbi:hypothetical protein BDV06DRAFT_219524 [Aspergillus oleicola]